MTVILTICPNCGEVTVSPEDILLHVLPGGRQGVYSFSCPTCTDDVEKRANRKVMALLVSAGVEVEDRTNHPSNLPPAEPDPRGSLPQGPAFTLDDLIDFHFLLLDDRFIEDFLDEFQTSPA